MTGQVDEAERYVITVKESRTVVRLEDTKTGEIHIFAGREALLDAIGVLIAIDRERDAAQGED
jgi:hypothetical protein